MRTKVRTWTRFFLLLAMIAAAAVAWVCTGPVPASADVEEDGRQGEVSLLALPENVTVTEITVELTGSATTASSYEQIKNALTVTATGSDGMEYPLGSDEFELSARLG